MIYTVPSSTVAACKKAAEAAFHAGGNVKNITYKLGSTASETTYQFTVVGPAVEE